MNEISTLFVQTVLLIPRSVRPLLAQVLAKELQYACQDRLWGFVCLYVFPKAALRAPPRGRKKNGYVVKEM